MIILPVELLQDSPGIAAHRGEHCPKPGQVLSGEHSTAILGDEHQVGVQVVDRMSTSSKIVV